MSSRPTRRTYLTQLAAVGMGGVVSLAGCSEYLPGGPDPQVVDAQSNQNIIDALGGNGEVRVLVENQGDSGEVLVTVTTYDSNGNTLDVEEQTVTVESDSRRRVDFRFSPSDGAQRFEAEAEAA